MHIRFKHNVIGPYQFLILSLLISETLFGYWMFFTKTDSTERIVAGAFSISVLITVLVIFCVIYSIKKKHDASEILKLKFVNGDIDEDKYKKKLKFVNVDIEKKEDN